MAQDNELSNREQEVINLLLEGKSNKQIASSLVISVRTVEFHLKNIYDKFQVSSRVELVLKLGFSTGADKRKELVVSTDANMGEARATPAITQVAGTTDTDKGEDLVISTVAEAAGVAENRDMLNSWDWATLLKEAVSRISKEIKMESVLNANTRHEGSTLTFYEAMRVCLVKYAEFEGRATRAEFWWFALFVTLAASALAYVSQNVSSIFLIAMLLPFLAAGARRLHDIGKSGWWQLFLLAPFAGVILLMLWAQPSENLLTEERVPA